MNLFFCLNSQAVGLNVVIKMCIYVINVNQKSRTAKCWCGYKKLSTKNSKFICESTNNHDDDEEEEKDEGQIIKKRTPHGSTRRRKRARWRKKRRRIRMQTFGWNIHICQCFPSYQHLRVSNMCGTGLAHVSLFALNYDHQWDPSVSINPMNFPPKG